MKSRTYPMLEHKMRVHWLVFATISIHYARKILHNVDTNLAQFFISSALRVAKIIEEEK